MKTESMPVTVRVLEKDYLIACPAGEEDSLQESARFLNEKVKEIRRSGKVVGNDRIAVMAALNVAHELLQYQSKERELNKSLGSRIKALQDRLEAALSKAKQMEL